MVKFLILICRKMEMVFIVGLDRLLLLYLFKQKLCRLTHNCLPARMTWLNRLFMCRSSCLYILYILLYLSSIFYTFTKSMSNLLTPKKCLFSVVKKHIIFHSICTIRRKKTYLTFLNTLNFAFSLFFVHFSPFLNLFKHF